MKSKKKDPNKLIYKLADEIEKKPNVLACYVKPASSTSQEPEITVIVEDMSREIFPVFPVKATFRSIHNSKNWYMDEWGKAWYTFWMLDYMKTNEYVEYIASGFKRSWAKRWFGWIVGL